MKSKDTTICTTEKRDWGAYNRALVDRGKILFVYIEEGVVEKWRGTGRYTYSDDAIQFAMTVQQLFTLRLRTVTGFLQGLFRSMNTTLTVPDYTTISRRARSMQIPLTVRKKDAVAIIVDSTGLKVFGEGEWKVRKHGYEKRRTWKKVHLAIDRDGEIRVTQVTDNSVHDKTQAPSLITEEKAPITDFFADGAYDSDAVYDLLSDLPPDRVHIPPRKDAVLGKNPTRDKHITTIKHTSLKEWKQSSGYHTRSLVETTMFRLKTTFGNRLYYRTSTSQENEVLIRCSILNDFNRSTIQKQEIPS